MNKVLITGGTGLVGTALIEKLLANNIKVAVLSRSPKKENEYKWDIANGYIDKKAFEGVTHIIHLAGAGIADKKWSTFRKRVLINSRVASANLLFKKVQELGIKLKGFISASGIGYYGAVTVANEFKEQDTSGNDFIAKICVEWEQAAKQFEEIKVPVTILRIGIVLSEKGGALQKINTPLFLSSLGSGKQYMPWIHIDDLVNILFIAIEDDTFKGIYNCLLYTSPSPRDA